MVVGGGNTSEPKLHEMDKSMKKIFHCMAGGWGWGGGGS